MNIVAIVGSPRVQGNTSYLVDQALAEAKKLGIETEKIILTQHQIAPCLGHDDCGNTGKCKQDDDFNSVAEKYRTADGLILATPVYNHNVSAQLKAFLDRTRLLKRLNHKVEAKCAGLIAIAANSGMEDTLAILRRYLQGRSNLSPDNMLTLGARANNLGDARNNAALVEQARQLGRQLAQKLKASLS